MGVQFTVSLKSSALTFPELTSCPAPSLSVLAYTDITPFWGWMRVLKLIVGLGLYMKLTLTPVKV